MNAVEMVAWTAMTILTLTSWVCTWVARTDVGNARAFEQRARDQAEREGMRSASYAQECDKHRIRYEELAKTLAPQKKGRH